MKTLTAHLHVFLECSRSQMSHLCRELSSELKERRKFSDAAFILNEYLKDYEECVAALTDGCLWEEAIRVSHQHDRLDLIETHVKPGIKDHCTSLITKLIDDFDSFKKYKTRLSVLRVEKLKAQQEKEEKENDKMVEEEAVDESKYFLPILTSYVMKKEDEDLISALKRVQSIK
ncbi:hypothetical protein J437_LFUL015854, partial [Ladona fulva]